MRKVIQGKVYDTDTADLVADYFTDINSYGSLHRTGTGHWFAVHHDGHGASITPLPATWAEAQDEDWITAQEFLMRHNEMEAIEKYFPKHLQEA